jgi:hypothetical protein
MHTFSSLSSSSFLTMLQAQNPSVAVVLPATVCPSNHHGQLLLSFISIFAYSTLAL